MRLFVAIDPGPAVVERVVSTIAEVRALSPNSKWIRPEGAHITLAFLGEVDEARLPELAEAIESAAKSYPPIDLRISGCGSFGKGRRPRVLWAGVAGEEAALRALAAAQKELERALEPIGYRPEERAFSPHLTLARARDPKGDEGLFECAEAIRTVDFGAARIEALTLYRSETAKEGAIYTKLAEGRLGGG